MNNTARALLKVLLILVPLCGLFPAASGVSAAEPVIGVDISMLPRTEDGGGVFTEDGAPDDAMEILAGHGVDFVRLRIWHTPADGYCGLERTLAMAARAKALGLGLLLDFHYSDTWADPGKQYKPAAWVGLSTAELTDSVYQYTRDVITTLRGQGTIPDWVQIGNEIICGMLWDTGRICNPFDTPAQWEAFAGLIQAGLDGVSDAQGPGDSITTMIHIDDGGDNGASIWFYDNLLAQGVDFDLIGLSFYPWWHGTLGDLAYNMNNLASRYGKGIVVVETSYPWTLGWNDDTHNNIGLESQLHAGFPATVQGQQDFLSALLDTIRAVPDGKGLGLFYWEPAYIAAPSAGSSWENLALFDFDGELLASIAAFEDIITGMLDLPVPDGSMLHQNHPNPFNPSTTIRFYLPERCAVRLEVFDVSGRRTACLIDDFMENGPYATVWTGKDENGTAAASGVYFYTLSAGEFRETRKMVLLR